MLPLRNSINNKKSATVQAPDLNMQVQDLSENNTMSMKNEAKWLAQVNTSVQEYSDVVQLYKHRPVTKNIWNIIMIAQK